MKEIDCLTEESNLEQSKITSIKALKDNLESHLQTMKIHRDGLSTVTERYSIIYKEVMTKAQEELDNHSGYNILIQKSIELKESISRLREIITTIAKKIYAVEQNKSIHKGVKERTVWNVEIIDMKAFTNWCVSNAPHLLTIDAKLAKSFVLTLTKHDISLIPTSVVIKEEETITIPTEID